MKIKTGDLIYYDTSYYTNSSGIHQYCRVLDIIHNDKSVDELIVITGRGERNTKAKFLLKILGTESGNFWRDMNGVIDEKDKEVVSREDIKNKVDSDTFWTNNTHGIYKIDLDEAEKYYQKAIKMAQLKFNFIKKNQNRDYKLDIILKEN